jgi:large subunit ribosomal protein L21
MFAVVKTGGKQYRVEAGDVLRIELVAGEPGEKVQFNEVLMVGSTVGAPMVAGAAVQAEVVEVVKADKVITYHKRRRKHSSQRTRGHRQQLTVVRITDILESGADASGVKAAEGVRAVRRAAHDTSSSSGPVAKAAGAVAKAAGRVAKAAGDVAKAATRSTRKPAAKAAAKTEE